MVPPRPARRATGTATATPEQSQENDAGNNAPDGGEDDDPLLLVGVVVGVAAEEMESVGGERGEIGAVGPGLVAGLEGLEIHGDGCGGVDEIRCWGIFPVAVMLHFLSAFGWVDQCN